MAVHAWTVLCSRVIIDSRSGHASVIDAADQLILNDTAAGLARELARATEANKHLVVPVEYDFFSQWKRSDASVAESIEVRIVVVSPAGERKVRANYVLDLKSAPAARLHVKFDRLILRGFGRYLFELEEGSGDNWSVVSSYPLDVVFRELPEPSTESAPSEPNPQAAPSPDSPPAPSRRSPRPAAPKRQRRQR